MSTGKKNQSFCLIGSSIEKLEIMRKKNSSRKSLLFFKILEIIDILVFVDFFLVFSVVPTI